MPSFFDQADRNSLLERLDHLRPDARARFGKFDAPKMVQHLIESMKMATGELVPRARNLPMLPLLRPLFIHYLPWPKGSPTAPELLKGVPTTWERDVATLRSMLAEHPYPKTTAEFPVHPAFGPMTHRDWGVLIYRHVDHHFSQFGC